MRIDLEGERAVASGCRAGACPRWILLMRRTISIALVVAMNAVAPLDAHADWQYTRWGMTPDQVMAASTDQLKACDEACKGQDTNIQIARFFGPYQSGPFNFTAYMLFDRQNNTLAEVTLDLNQPNDAGALVDALKLKYGEPMVNDYSKSMKVIIWRDPADEIDVVVVGDQSRITDTSLSYAPRQDWPTETFDTLPFSSPRTAVPASYLAIRHAIARAAAGPTSLAAEVAGRARLFTLGAPGSSTSGGTKIGNQLN
jgi:hypothetical protein